MKPCPWCEATGSYQPDGDGRLIVWACYSYETEVGQPAQSIECENNVLRRENERLQSMVEIVRGVDFEVTDDSERNEGRNDANQN